MNSTKPANKYWKHSIWFLLPGFAGFLYYFFWIWNPLPSDEAMIENFNAHRADFVEVVRRYREYDRSADKSHSFWFKEGDTLQLYKRAGIDSIDDTALRPWLPNPYSAQTAKAVDEEIRNAKSFQIFHKYGALRITPARSPRFFSPENTNHYRWNGLVHGSLWKDYYFFPEVPRIENDELLGPIRSDGDYSFRARVFASLNRLPPQWKDFECVYRQIEPQWFIRMCNGH